MIDEDGVARRWVPVNGRTVSADEARWRFRIRVAGHHDPTRHPQRAVLTSDRLIRGGVTTFERARLNQLLPHVAIRRSDRSFRDRRPNIVTPDHHTVSHGTALETHLLS